MDVPVIVDAMRRVARGELFLQDGSSDLSTGPFRSCMTPGDTPAAAATRFNGN